MRFIVGLACLSVGAVSLALADPSTTAPAEPAPHAAPAASATPAVDPEEKRLLAQGYRMQMRQGEKVFCRREGVTGSRLGKQDHCGTVQQLKVTAQRAREALESAQHAPNPPKSN